MGHLLSAIHLSAGYQLTGAQWALAVVGAVCIGLSKTGFSGVSLVNVAIMAAILPARQSTGVVLPMLVFADCFAVGSFQKHTLWPEIRRVLPAALVGIVAGTLLMQHFSGPSTPPDAVFRRIIGTVVLALTLLQAARRAHPEWFTKVTAASPLTLAWIMGGLTGLTTMIANGAGPVMTIYLLMIGLPKYELVGTSAWVFLLLNVSKLPFSYGLGLINADSLGINLWLAPAVVAGALLGRWLLARVPQGLFETLILAFSFIAALRLLWG